MLVGGSSRTADFRSTEVFATDHSLVVATLKLHVKSKWISKCNHYVFHLEKLKDLKCSHEYAVTFLNWFEFSNPLRIQYNCGILLNVKLSRLKGVHWETSEVTERRCFGGGAGQNREELLCRMAGNREQYRALSRRTRALLRRDKEQDVRRMSRLL